MTTVTNRLRYKEHWLNCHVVFLISSLLLLSLLVTPTLADYQEQSKPPHPHIIFVTLRDMVSLFWWADFMPLND